MRLLGRSVLAELTARFVAAHAKECWPGRWSTTTVRWSTVAQCCRPVRLCTCIALPDSAGALRCPSAASRRRHRRRQQATFLGDHARGRHVAQTALGSSRTGIARAEPSQLDRLTQRVLLFTTRREVRGSYRNDVRPRFGAQDYLNAHPRCPRSEACRAWSAVASSSARAICRRSGGVPSAERWVEPDGARRCQHRHRPGRTHQLRVRMAALGIPIMR